MKFIQTFYSHRFSSPLMHMEGGFLLPPHAHGGGISPPPHAHGGGISPHAHGGGISPPPSCTWRGDFSSPLMHMEEGFLLPPHAQKAWEGG